MPLKSEAVKYTVLPSGDHCGIAHAREAARGTFSTLTIAGCPNAAHAAPAIKKKTAADVRTVRFICCLTPGPP
jgi:hypothetical protein